MTDFFTRLAQRSLGLTPTVQPLVASMFEPENRADDRVSAPLEAIQDTALGEADLFAPMSEASVLSAGTIPPVNEPPPVLASSNPGAYSSSLPEPHSETREARKQAVARLLTTSQDPALPEKDDPLQERHLNEVSKQKQEMPGQRKQKFPAPIAPLYSETTAGEQKPRENSSTVGAAVKYDRSLLIEPEATHVSHTIKDPLAPQQAHTGDTPSQLSARTMLRNAPVQGELVAPLAPARRQTPATHSQQATTVGKNSAGAPVSVSTAITHLISEERSPSRLESGIPAPIPTVQVTIRRVEVRATPAPKSDAHPRQQCSAPTAMGLDEYLRQRSQGGRS